MAIDSSLFAADIPAGTYTAGDVLQLSNIDGPALVRSGRGSAILKTVFVGMLDGSQASFRVHVKNSDWVDEVVNVAASINNTYTAFDEESGCSQAGHNANLQPNSGWQIYAECVIGGVTTANNSIFCLIDVDYPSAGGLTNPREVLGLPVSIDYDKSVNAAANGTMLTSTWATQSVDYFKAGSEYALDAVELVSGVAGVIFVAFSNAAGMSGLQRIIPVVSNIEGIKYPVRYSSKLVKGPMDVKIKAFAPTAGVQNLFMVHDYVKRSA